MNLSYNPRIFSELSEGLGYDNLKLVLDVMALVSDDNDIQVWTATALGT